MKQTFNSVRPACDLASILSDEASLSVVDGRMEAFNKELIISVPCEGPDFCVPVVDFEFAMRKHEDPTIKITEKNVILDGTTRVRRLTERKSFKKPNIDTKPVADVLDLLATINDVFPFTEGDQARPWSFGARFDNKTVTATNSIMFCQAELDADAGFAGFTVSRTGLAYMRLRGAALKAWGIGDRGLLLEFDDGGWALVSKMAMEMPDAAVGLVNTINNWRDMQQVDEAYRNAFTSAGEWADDVLTVFPDRVYAGRLSTEHDEEVETNLGDREKAMFATKNLVTVMSVAKEIAFDRYPQPVPFVTERGSKGLIAGRSS